MTARPRFAIASIGPMVAPHLAGRVEPTAKPGNPPRGQSHGVSLCSLDPVCGIVGHVFESSFSIQCRHGPFVCIGAATIGDGPLNAVCHATDADWPSLGIHAGQAVAAGSATLHLADGPSFEFSGATRWQAPPWPVASAPADLPRALRVLAAIAQSQAPDDGLARIAFGDGRVADAANARDRGVARATKRRAMLQAATLSDWLTGQLDRDKTLEPRAELATAAQQAVHALIGLGPGLTPSGDDLISGMMIALHACSETTVARGLANFVRTAPPDATNALSRAFLEAAAEGYPSAALHHAIAALLAGDALALPAAVDRLGRVGHTSGWDMLAGAVLALSAVAEAQLRSPPNPRS